MQAIGEAIAENGRVIVTGCMGNEADRDPREVPLRCSRSPARTSMKQWSRQCTKPPRRRHGTLHRSRAACADIPATYKTHPAPLWLSEDFEGCNHACSFCIIPSLRGNLVSRRVDAVLREAEKLVAAGTKELLVISQDTSAYGVDIGMKSRAHVEGREVRAHSHDRPCPRTWRSCALPEGDTPWVRLHYVYPYPHVDAVIPLMAEGLVTPYLDIPFQHASPSVLKAP